MARNLDEIIADLDSYVPSYDWLPLSELTQELLETGEAERAIPVLFSIMEKYPDEDLGSPGPIVHTLEKCKGYESHLIEKSRNRKTGQKVSVANYRSNRIK